MSWQRWAERAAARQARVVGLEEALLGGRFAAYAWYRLRWMAAGRAVGLALHAVELAFLVRGAGSGLTASLVIGNGCLLAAGFWWGLLELLRNRLRDGAEPAVEVGVWLRRSLLVALLVAAGGAAAVAVDAAGRGFGPLHLWALVVVGRLAVDLPLRTYYSGVYARRRVFRPFAAILAAEAAGVAGVLALWQALGPWAFPVALAGQALLARGLLLAYTARAYAAFRVPRPALRARRPRTAGAIITAAWAGLAGVAGRLGSLLVLVLLADAGGVTGTAVVALHLAAPLLATASSWAQVFYLDVRRLDDEAQAALRRRLAARMAPLAWIAGALCWLAGAAVAVALLGTDAVAPLAALLPLFLAQARLAAPQLAGFAQREYLRVVAGALVLAGAAVVLLGAMDALQLAGGASRPLALAAATVAALAAFEFRRTGVRGEPPTGHKRAVAAWLRALAAAAPPLRLVRADLSRTRSSQRVALAGELAARLGERGAVCIHGRALYWFEAGGAPPLPAAELAVLSGGLVDALTAAPAADAAEARTRAAALGLDAPVGNAPAAELVAEFRRRFPDGLVEDLGAGGTQLAGVDPAVRRQLWSDALLAARGGRRRRGSPWEVTAFVPAGEITVLFAAPRSAPPEARRTWRAEVDRATWAASFDAVTRSAAEGGRPARPADRRA